MAPLRGKITVPIREVATTQYKKKKPPGRKLRGPKGIEDHEIDSETALTLFKLDVLNRRHGK